MKKLALIAVACAALCMPASARDSGKNTLDIGAGRRPERPSRHATGHEFEPRRPRYRRQHEHQHPTRTVSLVCCSLPGQQSRRLVRRP